MCLLCETLKLQSAAILALPLRLQCWIEIGASLGDGAADSFSAGTGGCPIALTRAATATSAAGSGACVASSSTTSSNPRSAMMGSPGFVAAADADGTAILGQVRIPNSYLTLSRATHTTCAYVSTRRHDSTQAHNHYYMHAGTYEHA
jgi:hypothetical protein